MKAKTITKTVNLESLIEDLEDAFIRLLLAMVRESVKGQCILTVRNFHFQEVLKKFKGISKRLNYILMEE
jgi:hypothetical protein